MIQQLLHTLAADKVGHLVVRNVCHQANSSVHLHRNYTWKTKILQVKTLPKGWCINYDCKVTVEVDTRVGLVAHVPNDEVTYLVRGQRVKKLLDHEYVIVLDLSHLPDVREGEEVTIILPGPNSPLDSYSSTPVTLRDGAGPGKGK